MVDKQNRDFDPLFDAIDAELAERHQNSEPMRVHLWDSNHFSPIPREIIAHPRLFDTLQQYGKPAYAIEIADYPEQLNNDAQIYQDGAADERQAIAETWREYGTNGAPSMFTGLINVMDKGGVVYFPDTRGDAVRNMAMTAAEQTEFNRFVRIMKQSPIECSPDVLRAYTDTISEERKENLDGASKKLIAAARGDSLAQTDQKISQNISQQWPDDGQYGKTASVTLYGAAHYVKERDLNEWRPGLDIAIADSPKASGTMKRKLITSAEHLPDYVWYQSEEQTEGRLVKLDHDAARAEYLGFDHISEYKNWLKGRSGDSQLTIVSRPSMNVTLSPEQQEACDEAAETIRKTEAGDGIVEIGPDELEQFPPPQPAPGKPDKANTTSPPPPARR